MKNKFMRIAAVMLMLCLVTTCAISGTFAKYTTATAGQDTARVAYWGWTSTTLTLDELFADTYNTGKVQTAVTGENVIAPGTTNSTTFTITYTDGAANSGAAIKAPEVAYSFVIDTEGSTTASNDILTNKNIQWRLNTIAKNGTETEGTWGNWTTLLANIEALSEATVAANALPSAFNAGQSYEIEWQWIFETPDDDTTTDVNEGAAQDKIDTDMGNATDLADIKIVLSITATQLN